MNTPDSVLSNIPQSSSAGAAVVRPGFFERAVCDALSGMSEGHLRMELPDGRVHVFGNARSPRTATIRVRDMDFFKRCVLFGDVGFGETYVDGIWETDDIKAVITWFLMNVQHAPSMSGSSVKGGVLNLLRGWNRLQHLLRPNSLDTSRRNIREHYDLGNDFYSLWLDPTMTYSSAYWTSPEQTLKQAQTSKYDVLCRKLRLQPSDHVLEIGSGWGGFACHAVKNYGSRVTTVTISEEQYKYAKERFVREGVADRVEIRIQDYRHITGSFDKIASIEMLEAVGDRYLETYFAKCHELLAPGGLLGLQYITCPDNRHDELRKNVDWIQKHIFPGSLLLSIDRVNRALRNTGDLFLFDLDDMGLFYARTLRLWFEKFNQQRDRVKAQGFDDRFIRKWNYYLNYCEAAFAMRNISVVQAVYTRANNPSLRANPSLS
ncbi:MAG TPA: cyclopropane-fatty-acyl-phospholipid synthase family protein [Roseimicrobium sp.]|nr:cyclopropane-fatty-acyl-phospholipid synthase family protein [Roseimicrobium sp.]